MSKDFTKYIKSIKLKVYEYILWGLKWKCTKGLYRI